MGRQAQTEGLWRESRNPSDLPSAAHLPICAQRKWAKMERIFSYPQLRLCPNLPAPLSALQLIHQTLETITMAETTDDRLRLLIERVERLEEEKKGIADDIKDVYGEAKAVGYDAKIMRKVVALRKMKPDDRAEMEAILDVYKAALGLG